MNNDQQTTLQELKDLLKDFRDERDWSQFHNPKDLAEAISVEAGELVELFLWKDKGEVAKRIQSDPEYKKEVEEELADVINFCLNFANAVDVDITSIVKNKLEKNVKKYPIEKARGIADKYTKL